MAKRMTQKDYVRKALLDGKRLTPDDARDLCGSSRLAAIIHELRHKEGMNISTSEGTCKNRIGGTSTYAIYKLED